MIDIIPNVIMIINAIIVMGISYVYKYFPKNNVCGIKFHEKSDR